MSAFIHCSVVGVVSMYPQVWKTIQSTFVSCVLNHHDVNGILYDGRFDGRCLCNCSLCDPVYQLDVVELQLSLLLILPLMMMMLLIVPPPLLLHQPSPPSPRLSPPPSPRLVVEEEAVAGVGACAFAVAVAVSVAVSGAVAGEGARALAMAMVEMTPLYTGNGHCLVYSTL